MEGKVQVIPLGGAGEIGRNCTLVVQGDDMIMVDCGLSFPSDEMHGIDIVIPDFQYVLENKEKLRAVILTHAHEDHVGALSYLLREVNVPVYSSDFTIAMVRQKLDEKIDLSGIETKVLKPGEKLKCGELEIETIRITHSIPDTTCVAVRTHHGIVLFTADFKFDFTPVDGKLSQIGRLAELGEEGVLLLLTDSTNVDRQGWGPSERLVSDGFRKVFRSAPGRVLITTFASNIHRMQQAFEVAAETGRKVAATGRRMEQAIDLCIRLGYIQFPREVWIRLDDISKYPDDKLVILTTGSQGEPMAALSQMSREEYGRMKIRQGDTVIYSARPIPGNEAGIWRTINRLFKLGANVIYKDEVVHVSGHAYAEEIKMMINLTRPYYIAPVHGEPRHQHHLKQMTLTMGYPDHRVFTINDGSVLVMDETRAWLSDPVPSGMVLIDSSGSIGVSGEILRERTTLANDGVVVATLLVDEQKGTVLESSPIQAKGFIGGEQALQDSMEVLLDSLSSLSSTELKDTTRVEFVAADILRKQIYRRTQTKPVVVATVVSR